ncbi:MAG: DUF58 domain-containing protein [Caldilineaceae bacterium]
MQLTIRGLILGSITAVRRRDVAAWFLWIAPIWLIGVGALLLPIGRCPLACQDWTASPPRGSPVFGRVEPHRGDGSTPPSAPFRVVRCKSGCATIRRPPLASPTMNVSYGDGDSGRNQDPALFPLSTPPRRLQLRRFAPALAVGVAVSTAGNLPATEPVKVYPNLVDVKKFDLLLRKNKLWELGVRNVRQRGAGTEFERLREYQPDDEYRCINWKATARRGVPITMEYETERSQNIIALLDVGRLMRSPVGNVAKMDYAINAVLLLAYVASKRPHRRVDLRRRGAAVVGAVLGQGQFHRMLELLYKVQGQPVESDYSSAFAYLAARQNRRSLLLVFTDLTGSVVNETLVAQMLRLRRSHLPLLATMRRSDGGSNGPLTRRRDVASTAAPWPKHCSANANWCWSDCVAAASSPWMSPRMN